ncbi:MAG: beta-lactamase family protein [Acidobacteriota bacterium]|nr:MAG: beta-lactamase family protein [Acidobacteriota bacterium]
MSSDPLKEFVESRIDAGDFPSATWFVADEGGILSEGSAGLAVTGDGQVEASVDTIYDLASLTKPLVTGLLFAILLESGEVALDDLVSGHFEEFAVPGKREITFEDLLSHRTGYEAWRPFYLEVKGDSRDERVAAVVRRIAELPLSGPIGSRVVYSDLNFLLLGALIEKISGRRLDELAVEHIFRPLGLKSTFFLPPNEQYSRIAASEEGNAYERELSEEMGFETHGYEWRTGVIRGEVHDENCRFLGGYSGHAGLFSTAAETARIASQFLPGSELLKPDSLALFRENLTPGLDQARSCAFQLAATKDSSAHGAIPETSFGHLGFTGTMVWIDPESARIYVLLTNRTHGKRPPFADLFYARSGFLRIAARIVRERR